MVDDIPEIELKITSCRIGDPPLPRWALWRRFKKWRRHRRIVRNWRRDFGPVSDELVDITDYEALARDVEKELRRQSNGKQHGDPGL